MFQIFIGMQQSKYGVYYQKGSIFARSAQHGSSMVMVIMLSMNTSIEASFASIFNSSRYAFTSRYETGG